jgi:hypothetical protein
MSSSGGKNYFFEVSLCGARNVGKSRTFDHFRYMALKTKREKDEFLKIDWRLNRPKFVDMEVPLKRKDKRDFSSPQDTVTIRVHDTVSRRSD